MNPLPAMSFLAGDLKVSLALVVLGLLLVAWGMMLWGTWRLMREAKR